VHLTHKYDIFQHDLNAPKGYVLNGAVVC